MWHAKKDGAGEDCLRSTSVYIVVVLTLECGDPRRFLSFSVLSIFSFFSLSKERKESGGDRRTPKPCPHPSTCRQYALVD